ncbi:MAG: carbon-nitrogen hydrolase family protein [Phototrophicaceae bacterium]|jgi:predicted amidohydrolase
MREITVAVVQMKPKLGEMEDNLVKMSDMISKIASQQRVDLIVFPELVTSGFELGVRFTELAQRVPGPTVNLIAQRADEYGVYVAFGMVTKEKVESVLYNSAVMVGPGGELLDVYNKIHLRGEERMAFREGYKLPVMEIPDLANVGMMVGYDLAYPEVARSMALDGAELLIVIGNWEAAHIDEWKTYVRSRAYENSVFMIAANRVGEDVTMTFGGESMIVGPRGEIYASMVDETDPDTGEPLEGFTVARIDLENVRRFREEFQFMQTRQPATYRAIVKKY